MKSELSQRTSENTARKFDVYTSYVVGWRTALLKRLIFDASTVYTASEGVHILTLALYYYFSLGAFVPAPAAHFTNGIWILKGLTGTQRLRGFILTPTRALYG